MKSNPTILLKDILRVYSLTRNYKMIKEIPVRTLTEVQLFSAQGNTATDIVYT